MEFLPNFFFPPNFFLAVYAHKNKKQKKIPCHSQCKFTHLPIFFVNKTETMSVLVKQTRIETERKEKDIKIANVFHLIDTLLASILNFLYVEDADSLRCTHRTASTHLLRVYRCNVSMWHIRTEKRFLNIAHVLENTKGIRYLTLSFTSIVFDTLARIHNLLLKRLNSLHTVCVSSNYILAVLATQCQLRVLRVHGKETVSSELWDIPTTVDTLSLSLYHMSTLKHYHLRRLRHLTVTTPITSLLPLLRHLPNLVTLRLEAWTPTSEVDVSKFWDGMSKMDPLEEVYIVFGSKLNIEYDQEGEAKLPPPTLIRHRSLRVLAIRDWQGKYRPHIECPNLHTLEFGGITCWTHPQLHSRAWMCPTLRTLDLSGSVSIRDVCGDMIDIGGVIVPTNPLSTLSTLRYNSPLQFEDMFTFLPGWSHLRILEIKVEDVTDTVKGRLCIERVLLECRSLQRLTLTSVTTYHRRSRIPSSTRATKVKYTHHSLLFLTTSFGDNRFWTRWRFPHLHRLTVRAHATLPLYDLITTCPNLVELRGCVDTLDPPTRPLLESWRHLTTLQLNSSASVWKWALYLYYHGTPLERWAVWNSTFLPPPSDWIQPPSRHIRVLAFMIIPLLQSGQATWEETTKITGRLTQSVDLYTGESRDSDDFRYIQSEEEEEEEDKEDEEGEEKKVERCVCA